MPHLAKVDYAPLRWLEFDKQPRPRRAIRLHFGQARHTLICHDVADCLRAPGPTLISGDSRVSPMIISAMLGGGARHFAGALSARLPIQRHVEMGAAGLATGRLQLYSLTSLLATLAHRRPRPATARDDAPGDTGFRQAKQLPSPLRRASCALLGCHFIFSPS